MQPTDLKFFLLALIQELSRSRCITPSPDVEELLTNLNLPIDYYQKTLSGNICFNSLVPLALKAMELGADPEDVSRFLNWVDFEVLVSNYLSKSGLIVFRNVIFSKKRFEIDVLGVDSVSKLCLVIDCKHWKPGYRKGGKLRIITKDHRAKVELLARECSFIISKYPVLMRVEYLVPVVITLTQAVKGVINGSLIVPVLMLRDFIANLRYYIDVLGNEVMIRNPCFLSNGRRVSTG